MAPHPFPKRASGFRQKKFLTFPALTHGMRLVRTPAGRLQAYPQHQKRHHRGSTGRDYRLLRHDPLRSNGLRRYSSARRILEALNTDLVCDAINTAMRELFLQIVYGRSQSAFSEDGSCSRRRSMEDLGKGLRCSGRHHVRHQGKGTALSRTDRGLRHPSSPSTTDGEIIGYEFVSLGIMMMDFIQEGHRAANEALEKAKGHYGQF